jgi:malate synthase
VLDDGRRVTVALFREILAEELARVRAQQSEAAYAAGQFERAAGLLDAITTAEKFEAFLTLPAYQALA